MLTITDHNRDYRGFRYIYPVFSRRAGGVSVGINLNPNNACNWACIYCQVPNLTRGGPPPTDLFLLTHELHAILDDIINGDFMQREVPEEARQLMDIAFSGNGEPTSVSEFPKVVGTTLSIMREHKLASDVKLRLITNGSLLHRANVQEGIRLIGEADGEVWFKIDRGTTDGFATINQIPVEPARALASLEQCTTFAPTWVQTCWFSLDGQAPDEAAESAYIELLRPAAQKIKGVHLYGLARPSLQPDAHRLGRLSESALSDFAARIAALGVAVNINP